MRKTTVAPTFAKFVNEAVEAGLLEANTSMPGKIKEYDESTQRASVIPLLKKKFNDTSQTIVDIPICVNVPVHQYSVNNGNTFIYLPVKPGDLGMLVFCTRSIDTYLASSPEEGAEVNPVYHDNPRHHDLSDAWFVPGIRPFQVALQNISADDIIIKNDKLTITIDPTGKISINNETNELIETLSTLIQNLIDAKVITMMGPQPFIASTIALLTTDKGKVDSFKG